jgi:hypothetical protein
MNLGAVLLEWSCDAEMLYCVALEKGSFNLRMQRTNRGTLEEVEGSPMSRIRADGGRLLIKCDGFEPHRRLYYICRFIPQKLYPQIHRDRDNNDRSY